MFKSEKFGEIQPQNMLKLKKLIARCIFCCQATLQKSKAAIKVQMLFLEVVLRKASQPRVTLQCQRHYVNT